MSKTLGEAMVERGQARLAEMDPTSPEALLLQTDIAVRTGEISADEAVKNYAGVIAANPDNYDLTSAAEAGIKAATL